MDEAVACMDEAVACIKTILELIDSGDLVRNTDRDSDLLYFLIQNRRISQARKEAKEIAEAWDKAKEVVL